MLSDEPTGRWQFPRVLEQSGVSGVRLAFTLGSSLLVLRWARATQRSQAAGKPLVEATEVLF